MPKMSLRSRFIGRSNLIKNKIAALSRQVGTPRNDMPGTIRLIFILLAIFFLCPCTVRAANEPEVIFYEIMWAGSSAHYADEWFVLKNTTDVSINIDGWLVGGVGVGGSGTIPLSGEIKSNDYFLVSRHSEDHEFKDDVQSILAIIPDRYGGDGKDPIISSFSLSNDHLELKLYKKQPDDSLLLIDIAGDSSKPLAGSSSAPKSSMVRKTDPVLNGGQPEAWITNDARCNLDAGATEWATPQSSDINTKCHPPRIKLLSDDMKEKVLRLGDILRLDFSITDDVNPMVDLYRSDTDEHRDQDIGDTTIDFQCQSVGVNQLKLSVKDAMGGYSEKSLDITCYQPANIVINEVMASPRTDYNADGKADTKDEWIELYNPDDRIVDLGGWYLQDANDSVKGKKRLLDDKSISAGGFLVLSHDDTGISLNDDSETVSLFDPSGALVSRTSWQDAEHDMAWAYNGTEYLWTTTVTPGAVNVFTLPLSVAAVSEAVSLADNPPAPKITYVFTTTVTHLDYEKLIDTQLPSFEYEAVGQILSPSAYRDQPLGGIYLIREMNYDWREPFLVMIMLLSLAGLTRKVLLLWL